MQSVARLVARSARSSAEHNCSRRKLASTARCGGGGGTKEEILKVPQSSAATMAEPAAGDAAARSRTASQVAAGIAQGERFFVGYCVVVYGSLLGLVLRRFRRA
ncbi:Os01g0629100 [Oryza sativa Japonica Group]|nr:Os01g0629100 [Oryza sativa Japonica Group]